MFNSTSENPAKRGLGRRFHSLRRRLYIQVFFAILCGTLLGLLLPHFAQALKPLGDAFIRLVKMVVAPVIFLTIVNGIAGVSNLSKVGRVAGKALAFFFVFSTLALIIGLAAGNLTRPGAGLHIDPASLRPETVAYYTAAAHDTSPVAFLMNIIPATAASAFAGDNILQILFFSIFFGLALSFCGEKGRPVLDFIQLLVEPVFRLVTMVMKTAPLGALGSMAFTIGAYGPGALMHLAYLAAVFCLTSLLFVLLVLGAACRRCGFSIFALLRYLREELLLVFGTSSSEAALPALIGKMEQAGANKSVVGLVVPTGYSFNLCGTNIHMTLAVLFIAQALDIPLSFSQQILILLVAMLSSKGMAGVPGVNLIVLAATLQIVPAVPVAGMALILGIDSFLDMFRSVTNIISNAVACITVAKWENELDSEKLRLTLSGNGEIKERADNTHQSGNY